jgi:hypothetical protein
MINKTKLVSQQGGDKSGDRGGEIPERRTIDDLNPCGAAGCAMQVVPLETCRDHRCPHRWQREAAEDRTRRRDSTANPSEASFKRNTPWRRTSRT